VGSLIYFKQATFNNSNCNTNNNNNNCYILPKGLTSEAVRAEFPDFMHIHTLITHMQMQ